MQPRVDLHTHPPISDGTYTPTELMRAAKAAGLSAIALTDHDTFAGLPEARAEARAQGIELVPGCELSLEFAGLPTHMLALFVDERPGHLSATLDRVRTARTHRNELMLHKLAKVGVHLRQADVEAKATGVVGRPHMAQAMLEAGVVKTFEEAFDRFLGRHGMAYVPKEKLGPAEAIKAVHDDGGLAVLAHPYLLTERMPHLEALVTQLKDQGLDGIEVYYTEHNDRFTAQLEALAGRMGLLMSGGSDFHGAVKPGVSLGKGRGGLFVPGRVLDAMKERLAERSRQTA